MWAPLLAWWIATMQTGDFTCRPLQTVCAGIDWYTLACREDGGAGHTLVVPFQNWPKKRVTHEYWPTPPHDVTIQVRTCAGGWTETVRVDAVVDPR
jgi:hypothetical protein